MSDEPAILERADVPAEVNDGTLPVGLPDPALAYDYFKSMASVSLATLGGVLTLGGTVFDTRIVPWQVAVAALSVAASGLFALQGQTDVMQLRQGMKPPLNSSRIALRAVPALYGLGLGIFLGFVGLSYFAPDLAAKLR